MGIGCICISYFVWNQIGYSKRLGKTVKEEYGFVGRIVWNESLECFHGLVDYVFHVFVNYTILLFCMRADLAVTSNSRLPIGTFQIFVLRIK